MRKSYRVVFTLIAALSFVSGTFVRVAAAWPEHACELPDDLARVVASKYPNERLITFSDIEEDDRNLFRSDHSGSCPGITKLDFYGDGQPTVAMVLRAKRGKAPVKLVLAHQAKTRWDTRLLDTGDSPPDAPVVWNQPPGDYQDIYGEKQIRAKKPVIVFCKYESWAIVYAWTGASVRKVWIAD
jgi:hypothetical protein